MMNLAAYILSVFCSIALWFMLLQITGETQVWFAPLLFVTSGTFYWVFKRELEK